MSVITIVSLVFVIGLFYQQHIFKHLYFCRVVAVFYIDTNYICFTFTATRHLKQFTAFMLVCYVVLCLMLVNSRLTQIVTNTINITISQGFFVAELFIMLYIIEQLAVGKSFIK